MTDPRSLLAGQPRTGRHRAQRPARVRTGRGRPLAVALGVAGLALAVIVPMQAAAASSAHSVKLGLYDQAMSQLNWDPEGMPSPQLAVTYYAWGERFQAGFAQTSLTHGAEPFVELGSWQCTSECTGGKGPTTPTLKNVAAGGYDKTYLVPFARSIAAYKHPVLITFDHEMNGLYGPYPWMNQPPAQYIAAWRHVYNVMHPIARNAIWIWAPGAQIGEGGVAQYFPGGKYLQQWGIDCYLSSPGQTYANACASTVAVIRKLTNDPGMLSETGIEDWRNRPERVTQLVDAVKAAGLTTLVWFDKGSSYLYPPGRQAMKKALG